MSTEPTVPSDTDEWKIPTIVEIDELRESEELSKAKFSEILDYSGRTGYGSVFHQKTIGYDRLRMAVSYFHEKGTINYRAPTVGEIADAVDRRGIAETHFSHAIGYTASSAFGNAKTQDRICTKQYRAALEALDYYDRNGFIPLPSELLSLHLDS